MKRKYIMNIQFFADDGNDGGTPDTGSKGGGSYSYEQAEEIANSRAERASKSALTNWFKSQGMSEEEANEAFKDFKAKKEAGKPNLSAIEKERDDAKAELASYKNKAELAKMNVAPEFEEFVESKVKGLVTDKKDFKSAATEFLKENPQYVKSTQYRMNGGTNSGNSTGTGSENKNSSMNAALRKAFGR